jgi:hypothetical protein
MYYQGEQIIINITDDDVINLSEVENFYLLVYPHYNRTPVTTMERSDASHSISEVVIEIKGEKEDEVIEETKQYNVYSFTINGETTKGFVIGDYDIEVLIANNGERQSIFKKTNAFYVEYSNSKNIQV